MWIRGVCNLACAVLLVISALAPRPPVAVAAIEVSDLLMHGVAYGVQALLMLWLLAALTEPARAMAGAWLVATLLGLATELLQMLQPARSAEVRDLVADGVGAAVAVALGWVLMRLARPGASAGQAAELP
jgi:VanZ family protein